MKPYSYFKTIAKIGLAGSFIKSIIAFLFVTLLPQIAFLLPSKLKLSNYQFLIIMAVVIFILVPCFRMGAIGFVSDSLLKKKTSLGNIFDGFKYVLKLIPLIFSKILPVIPFAVMAYIVFNYMSPETFEVLTKYANNPLENAKLLSSITDKDYMLMILFEISLIISLVLSIVLASYFAFTEYIIYSEKLSGIKALIKSMKMLKGHILYYIGFNFSFILWYLASGITMGASTLILNPYKEAAFILFYNYLRFENGEIEIPEPVKKAEEELNEEE